MTDPGESGKSVNRTAERPQKLLILLVVGFSIILLGVIVITLAAVRSRGGSASIGGVIFIGPIPIVIGAGPGASWLILFSIILAVLGIVVFLIMRREAGRVSA